MQILIQSKLKYDKHSNRAPNNNSENNLGFTLKERNALSISIIDSIIEIDWTTFRAVSVKLCAARDFSFAVKYLGKEVNKRLKVKALLDQKRSLELFYKEK